MQMFVRLVDTLPRPCCYFTNKMNTECPGKSSQSVHIPWFKETLFHFVYVCVEVSAFDTVLSRNMFGACIARAASPCTNSRLSSLHTCCWRDVFFFYMRLCVDYSFLHPNLVEFVNKSCLHMRAHEHVYAYAFVQAVVFFFFGIFVGFVGILSCIKTNVHGQAHSNAHAYTHAYVIACIHTRICESMQV
jgi:hypothetical protein